MEEKPYITRSHDVTIDNEYQRWLSELISRYRRAQVKAAVKINAEKLLWNWQMGRDLVLKKVETKWGAGIVEQVSLDLQAAFPGEKGFSSSNLWYMKKWFLFYTAQKDIKKLHQPGGVLQTPEHQLDIKLHQAGGEMLDDDIDYTLPHMFAYVPWRHHVEIITKCKSIEEAMYYLERDIQGSWSRDYLTYRLKEDDYNKRKTIPNNFDTHLPAPQSQLAKEVMKENLDLGFIALPEDFSEKMLEDALCDQLSRFLLELGNGFAFVGRQKEIVVAGKSRRIDLLFYHYRLRCFVVAEIKVTPFKPEYAGKLNFYVNAVDNLLKTGDDNPTIGLLICSNMNETEVQWSFGGITTPLGVASYRNIQEIKAQLPTVEQLKERIKLLESQIIERRKGE